MAVTNYYSANGKLLGEETQGVRTDYIHDALGSVTATINSSGEIVNQYSYAPFGAMLSSTGTGLNPVFQFVGVQGYRNTGRPHADTHVRKRSYATGEGRWTTVDPMAQSLTRNGIISLPASSAVLRNALIYVWQNPTTLRDRTGLAGGGGGEGGGGEGHGGGGGLGNGEACIELAIPADIGVDLSGEWCLECYSCCKPGQWASSCTSFSLSAGIGLDVDSILGLEGDIKTLVTLIGAWLSGLVGGIIACSNPEDGCVKPCWQIDVDVSASICLGINEDSVSCGYSSGACEEGGQGGFSCTTKVEWGICTDVGVSASISVGFKHCQ